MINKKALGDITIPANSAQKSNLQPHHTFISIQFVTRLEIIFELLHLALVFHVMLTHQRSASRSYL